MTKQVQLVGGNRETQDVYVGLPRELTVDESNQELRLHDGATPGGRKILNRDSNDARYQAKTPELDGLVFDPEDKGMVVRVGAGEYRLRKVSLNANQFLTTTWDGQSGDLPISLKNQISSSHTWTGLHSFTHRIYCPSFLGDLTGTSFGQHVGPVTGGAAGDHTGSFTGDVDVRSHNIQFDDGQIPFSALSGVPDASVPPIPAGGCIIWTGAANAIPDGWFLCDGTNGTPDLRGMFVIGAGGDYEVGDTGGSTEHGHIITIDEDGEHNHNVTVDNHILTLAEIPLHKHGNGVTDQGSAMFNHGTLAANPTTSDSIDNNGNTGTTEGYTTSVGGGEAHGHGGSASESGNHSHGANTQNTSHLPPFYAIAYIMKGA